jgi:hypothetical protein
MTEESSRERVGPINRALQRDMLLEMQGAYPNPVRGFSGQDGGLSDPGLSNLFYLQEHGLCDAHLSQGIDGHWSWGGAKITAKGLDFLEEDGGLSAILSVVTIKLHADTLRDLIAAKIDSSGASEAEKSALRMRLKKLSGTALEAASTDLVKQGLDHLPDAVHWIRALVGI